jgi:cysteine desulfurase/selenocysteine lyase
MYAPMGVGILYGKEEILEKLAFHGGGEMIATCSFEKTTMQHFPLNSKQEHQMLAEILQ